MATIFTPQNPSPRNEVRDMSEDQNFTVTIDGVKCTDYQIMIYRVSDSSSILDTGKINLIAPLADGETLTHLVLGGSVVNTGSDSYKWSIQLWNDTETVKSREFQFFAKTTPVLTFSVPSVITTQSYEFSATLVQQEGDIVSNYVFEIYNSNDELIETSGLITSFKISKTFDGFTSGQDFKARVFGFTTGNVRFDSGLVPFSVSYSEPLLDLIPEAEVNQNTSLITLSIPEIVQIIGVGDGDLTYKESVNPNINYLSIGDSSSNASFDVDVPLDFTLKFEWLPENTSFEGKIIELDNGIYEVGYVSGRFYWEINGVVEYTVPISLETNKLFYLFLLPTSMKFKYKYI